MMLFKVLVITVFCGLTVAFPLSELGMCNFHLSEKAVEVCECVFVWKWVG
jgi:hypothetical protein